MTKRKEIEKRLETLKAGVEIFQRALKSKQERIQSFEQELKELNKPRHGDIVELQNIWVDKSGDRRIVVNVDGTLRAFNSKGENVDTVCSFDYEYNYYVKIGNVFED